MVGPDFFSFVLKPMMWFLEDGVPGRARMLIQNLRHPAYRGPPNEMMNGINGVIEGI
jgi:hypothetical protein